MKIALPTDGKKLESVVNPSFGRTAYFMVVDSDTFEFEVLDNEAASAQGGAGPKAAQRIADSGADVLITFQCGQNAAEVIQAAEIKMLKAVPGSIFENVTKYKNGELFELMEIHAGYHNHGGM